MTEVNHLDQAISDNDPYAPIPCTTHCTNMHSGTRDPSTGTPVAAPHAPPAPTKDKQTDTADLSVLAPIFDKPPSFAAAAARAAKSPVPAANPKPRRAQNPTHAKKAGSQVTPGPQATLKDPVRLIIRFSGHPPEALKEASAAVLHSGLTSSFSEIPRLARTPVLGVHKNRAGNLIISLPHGTPKGTLTLATTTIRKAFGLPDSVMVTKDVAWSSIMLSSVQARPSSDTPVFTDEAVAETLLLNPALKDLSLTRPPRWVRKPTEIKLHSSVVFSFEDPDGTLLKHLLNTRLFAFGAPVTAKIWTSKKPRGPGSRGRH